MKKLNRIAFLTLLLLAGSPAIGQNAEMADTMRSEGKIYVVVVMILMVLAGLFIYLLLLDRKLAKMEKLIGDKEKTKS